MAKAVKSKTAKAQAVKTENKKVQVGIVMGSDSDL